MKRICLSAPAGRCATLLWRRRLGSTLLVAGLAFAIGGAAGAYAASGEPPEMQGTTIDPDLDIGDVAIGCLPDGECVDEGGALLKVFDSDDFFPREVSDGDDLDLGVTIQGTGYGLVEGRTVGGNAADRFCWTFPPSGGGPPQRKASGRLVCVDVREDASCTATSSHRSCVSTTSCGSAINLMAGRDGDPICTDAEIRLAESVTFGLVDLEMVIGFNVENASQNGSVTVATCAGFKPVCVADPTAPVVGAIVLNSIPLAVVHTPHLVQMGGKWCDTHTGKCK